MRFDTDNCSFCTTSSISLSWSYEICSRVLKQNNRLTWNSCPRWKNKPSESSFSHHFNLQPLVCQGHSINKNLAHMYVYSFRSTVQFARDVSEAKAMEDTITKFEETFGTGSHDSHMIPKRGSNIPSTTSGSSTTKPPQNVRL